MLKISRLNKWVFKSSPLAFRRVYIKTMIRRRNKTASILQVGSRYINLASTSPKGSPLDRCWDHFRSCFRKIGFWTMFYTTVWGIIWSIRCSPPPFDFNGFFLACKLGPWGGCSFGENNPIFQVLLSSSVTSYARLYIHVWLTRLLAGRPAWVITIYLLPVDILAEVGSHGITIMAFQTCLKFCFVTSLELWRSRKHVTSYEMGKFWDYPPFPPPPPMKKWILEKNVEFFFQCKMSNFFFFWGGHFGEIK